MTLIEINESDFELEVLQSSVPVAIDFYSEFCGPCRMVKPALESLAEELGRSAKIVTVDVVANANLAGQYSVSAVPTVLVFRNGKEVHRMVGLGALSELRDTLQINAKITQQALAKMDGKLDSDIIAFTLRTITPLSGDQIDRLTQWGGILLYDSGITVVLKIPAGHVNDLASWDIVREIF